MADNTVTQTGYITYTVTVPGYYTLRFVASGRSGNVWFNWSESFTDQSGQASTGDVRHGTVYGPTGNLTGTAYIPDAGSTALGVPVDDTVGTAIITQTSLETILDEAIAEVSAVPAANAGLRQKLNWLFALARNKITQTATTQTLRNDSDSDDVATASVGDDGTTFTRNKWAS